jgi:hypothetical protein
MKEKHILYNVAQAPEFSLINYSTPSSETILLFPILVSDSCVNVYETIVKREISYSLSDGDERITTSTLFFHVPAIKNLLHV